MYINENSRNMRKIIEKIREISQTVAAYFPRVPNLKPD